MLEEIHRNLLSNAADLVAIVLSESPHNSEIRACVRAGGALQVELDIPRNGFDEPGVRIVMLEPDGTRHFLANIAQFNCTQ